MDCVSEREAQVLINKFDIQSKSRDGILERSLFYQGPHSSTHLLYPRPLWSNNLIAHKNEPVSSKIVPSLKKVETASVKMFESTRPNTAGLAFNIQNRK